MSMRYIKSLMLFGFCLVSFSAMSQSNVIGFGESALAVNHKVSESYTANFALETRYFLYREATLLLKFQQVDFGHFSTLNLNYNHSLSFGIEYRNRDVFDEGNNELRFTEQFSYKTQKLGVRYGHRFRTEQRILKDEIIFRQRYRFAVDFPLNDEKLDIGEAYLLNVVEGLLSLNKRDKPETDIRFSSQIGWQVLEDLKLQTGLEYRIEAFNLTPQHRLFVLTTAILKI